MSTYHIPVMPVETMEYLDVQKDKWYIDCNLGGGGHTELILQEGGKVIGIDLDNDAIGEVTNNHQKEIEEKRLILVQSNFANIDEVVSSLSHPGSHEMADRISTDSIAQRQNSKSDSIGRSSSLQNDIQGVFFDLGVSTHQLDTADRGFSFNADAPLDMRMNNSLGASAMDLVNGLYEKELADIFWKFGEENFSRPIAKAIVEYRKQKKIETTNELANVILSVRRRSPKDRTHPATRVFQALRIAVNDELGALERALPKAFEVLSPGGRIVVLSFHSLEDRIVKDYFRELSDQGKGTLLTKKPIETSEEESIKNPRARSAKLRAIEKI